MALKISIIGKTNTGKTTFFNAATMETGEISTYPFTTKQPVVGTGNATTPCVHMEFNVMDNPVNSKCIDGWRVIPIELIDLPGLIKGAWSGRGLGNQFLSAAMKTDAFIHIIDASGSIDDEGRIAEIGTGNPISDYKDIEEELTMWYLKHIEGNREEISKRINSGIEQKVAITEPLHAMWVSERHVLKALKEANLEDKHFDNFLMEDSKKLASHIRKISKPTVVVANKIELVSDPEKIMKRIQENLPDVFVIPSSTDSEFTLRKAEQKGYIKYIMGAENFEVLRKDQLTEKQMKALDFIRKRVLGEHFTTGIQRAVNSLIFKFLEMNVIYPVSNPEKLSDRKGRVLPDLILMRNGSTVEDLAKEIHSNIKGVLYAKDVRYGVRLPVYYLLRDRDIVSLVVANTAF